MSDDFPLPVLPTTPQLLPAWAVEQQRQHMYQFGSLFSVHIADIMRPLGCPTQVTLAHCISSMTTETSHPISQALAAEQIGSKIGAPLLTMPNPH